MITRRQFSYRAAARILALGAVSAVIAVAAGAAGAASANLAPNPSLETGTGATPDCWLLGGYGTNGYSWARTSDAHSGSYGETLTISSRSSGDRKMLTGFTSNCSPTATAGHTYTISVWYHSNATVLIFAFTRKTGAASNSYQWWAQGSAPASSSWRQAVWTTPAVPSGIAQLSAGGGLQSAGTVTMDDFSIVDNQAAGSTADTTAPSSSIACNSSTCLSTPYTSAVSVSLSATDNSGGSGVSSIRYTTDGTDPSLTNGAVYSGAFAVSSTTTVKYRAYDNAGNAEAVNSQTITIGTSPPGDTTAPSSTITCNGSPCSLSYYNAAVSVSLSAIDNSGGSGVSSIRYTTDGTTPTLLNGSTYTAPFTVPSSATVEYRAYDNAGNVEAANSQTVKIDTTAPTAAFSAPATVTGTVALTATASDNVSIASVSLLVDGSVVATDTAAPYSYSWNSTAVPDGSHTLSVRAVDEAGNSATAAPATVTVTNGSPPSQPPPSGTTITNTQGPGMLTAVPDATCAAQVYQSTWEPVPANNTANHSLEPNPRAVPWSNVGVPPSFTEWYAVRAQIDGQYTGTTDEILQWAACKWGIDPNLARATAVQETDWQQGSVGDVCGPVGEGSYGILQVKNTNCSGTGDWGGYPDTQRYTAVAADAWAAAIRACINGDFDQGWLPFTPSTVNAYVATHGLPYVIWGCVGFWFSGSWYDSGATSYISNVQTWLANRTWLTEGK